MKKTAKYFVPRNVLMIIKTVNIAINKVTTNKMCKILTKVKNNNINYLKEVDMQWKDGKCSTTNGKQIRQIII